jgi:hypothetical protein
MRVLIGSLSTPLNKTSLASLGNSAPSGMIKDLFTYRMCQVYVHGIIGIDIGGS